MKDKLNVFKLTTLEKYWTFYDVGNSAFVMMLTILSVFFNSVFRAQGMDPDDMTELFGLLVTISSISVAIISPILGAVADNKGMKKPLFTVFWLIGVASCALFLVFGFIDKLAGSYIYLIIIVIIGRIGLSGSCVFYDSMINDITTEARVDIVSSKGFGYGYIGSCIPFIVCLGLYAYSTMFENAFLSETWAVVISMLITGVWWFVCTLPLYKNYKQVTGVEGVPPSKQIKEAFVKLGRTFKEIRTYKAVFIFVLAYFFYINGVSTIIAVSVQYADARIGGEGVSTILLVVILLLTQVVAWIFAIIFGKLSSRYSSKSLIITSIIGYLAVVVYAIFLAKVYQFAIMAFFVGMFQGAIQALSRSYFARLVPLEKSNEFFGFFDISSKGAAALGSAVFTLSITVFNDARFGVGSLALFFIAGLICMFFLPKNAADKVYDLHATEGATATEVALEENATAENTAEE